MISKEESPPMLELGLGVGMVYTKKWKIEEILEKRGSGYKASVWQLTCSFFLSHKKIR
jgi:hypothetical protein